MEHNDLERLILLPEFAGASWESLLTCLNKYKTHFNNFWRQSEIDWRKLDYEMGRLARIARPKKFETHHLAEHMIRFKQQRSNEKYLEGYEALIESYSQWGLPEFAELVRRERAIFAGLDWESLSLEDATAFNVPIPEETQKAVGQLYQDALHLRDTSDFASFWTMYSAQTDRVLVLDAVEYNKQMVDQALNSEKFQSMLEYIEELQTEQPAKRTMFEEDNSLLATLAADHGCVCIVSIWTMLDEMANEGSRQIVAQSSNGTISLKMTDRGSPEDENPFRVDVQCRDWVSDEILFEGHYEQSTEKSRAKADAPAQARIDRWIEVVTEISTIKEDGVSGRLARWPLIGFHFQLLNQLFHPILLFEFYHGYGSQGISNKALGVTYFNLVFYLVPLFYVFKTGVLAIFRYYFFFASGYEFLVGILFLPAFAFMLIAFGFYLITTIAVTMGSVERRRGNAMVEISNLPTTGHENFITAIFRSASKNR